MLNIFAYCFDLTSVVSQTETPFNNDNFAFTSISSKCTLTVPADTRDAYIAAGWTEDVFMGGIVENISFADANVKALCVANWDANGDGELSEAEAAAVTDLGETFKGNTGITSFDELQYFTGLTVIGESAFEGCTNLASIILPQGLTWIRGNAFKNCTALTSIDLPVDLKDIGYFAFEQSGLTSLVIPEGMDIIQTNAFWKCANLVEVTWPADLTTINPYMFSNCTALETVTIPEGVTIIGEGAFRDCGSLTSVILPSSLTTIENSAFRESGLTSIEVPVGVKTIGYYAFNDCKNLTSVVLPEGITTFNNAVFAGCNNLTSVNWPSDLTTISPWTFTSCGFTSFTIPETVTEIGDHAFNNCNGLTEIIIPTSVTEIGESAFLGCNNVKRINEWFTTSTDYFHYNNWSTEADESGMTTPFIELWRGAGNMLNDATITHDPITGLTPGIYTATILVRFYNEANSTTYPSGVTFFANNASVKLSDVCMRSVYNSEFVGQSTLLYGELSLDCTVGKDGVLNLGFQIEDAVGDWLAFKNLDFELKVKNIDFADANVKALCVANWDTNGDGELSETEAAAVTDLGEVFKGNTTIQSFDELQYFTGLTSIGGVTFLDCSSLTSVTIPNSVTSIGNWAFSGCSGLTSVTIGSSVTSIGSFAFYKCSGLTSVTIPSSVTSIGESAFDNCSGLTSVTIPNSVTSIGTSAFDGCSGLTSMKVASGNPVYDSRDNCNAIIETATNTLISGCKSTVIPNSVTSIGTSAFDGCSGLTSVTIPNSVMRIGYHAFSGCSGLTSVTIPNSVTSIGEYAFSICRGLTSVTIPSSVTSIGHNAFYGCNNLKRINDWTTTSTDYFHFNSWSSEEDGSGITTPFIELWRGAGNMLTNATITHDPITELTPGLYTVTILARAYNEGNSTTNPSGFTFYANDASVALEDVGTNAVYNNQSTLVYADLSLNCIVGQDGILNIGFQIENAVGDWFAFKNLEFSYNNVEATSIVLNQETLVFTAEGQTTPLTATVAPADATDKSVTWSSSDETVATVSSDGIVTAVANGTAIITATTNDGSNLSAACTVTVDIPAVEPDTDISGLDNVIYIEAQSVYVGDEVTLDVKMKNTLIPVGCSFRLTLPSGFTLKRDEYDDVDYILGSRANKMSVNLSETSDASYNVALTPTSGTATIRGNEDTVVSFTLQVSDEAVAGTYPVRLTRSLIQSKVDGTTYDTSLSDVYVTFTVEDCLLGDVNGDGNITPSDAIMILYHYFEVGQNGFNVKAADVNGDGSITPADAIEVLYIYFNDSSGSKSRQTDFQELDPQ